MTENAERGRRAVVTGGAGFLGSWLCEALLARGWAVSCLDNRVTGSLDNLQDALSSPGFTYRDVDVTREVPPEEANVVYHLASVASPVHYQRLPVETLLVGSHGTLNALELARRTNARFVLASTSEVYGDPAEHPQRETYWGNVNPIGERSMYDEAKRFSEALTMAYRRHHRVDTGIVRIFNTYGPRMARHDGRMIPEFISRALRGEPLLVSGDGNQTRSLCYLTDTVDGLLAMGDSSHAGPINLGNPVEQSVNAIARRIVTSARSTSSIEHVAGRPDDPQRRCPDITQARDALGWAPRTGWEEGLAHTIRWFRERRP